MEAISSSFPVRCWSCGLPFPWSKIVTYQKELQKGTDRIKVFEKINIRRECCRSRFMGHCWEERIYPTKKETPEKKKP